MMRGKNRTRGLPVTLVAVAIVLFALAATAAPVPSTSGEAQVRTGKVVVGQWTERIKHEDGGSEVALITAWYDWESGTSYREIHDQRGALVRTLEGRKAPRPSPEEIQQAIDMVYRDDALGSLIRKQRLTVDGGFLLEQGPGEGRCTQGSRCLQIFLFDGVNVARHTVVDLKRGRIVYRNYVPPQNREIR